jgi:RND family efflux transporter MFP subunit
MNTKKTLALIGLIGVVAAGVAYRLKPAPEDAKKGPTEQAVGIAVAKTQDVPVMVDVNGAVVSLKTVDVRAQATNLLAKVHIKEGQFVAEGATLFSLDDRTDRANVEKANATLARDRTLGMDLDRQFGRAEELKTKNFIAQSALDTTTAQRDAQVALIKSDEAAVAAAQVALGYNTIRAPISGRTGLINVFPGSLILPTTTSMVTITQMDPIAVQFTIPESNLKDLQLALKTQQNKTNVKVRIPATNDEQAGHLYFVDNAVDATTGTIKAKAQFANKDNLLWPGQFLQVRVELATLKDAITIPSAAVITGLTGKFVYVAGEDNTVTNTPIQVRHTFGDSMAVTGIKAGDRIVTDGKQNLRPGGKIRVISPQAPKSIGASGEKPADKDKSAEKPADINAKPTEASKP